MDSIERQTGTTAELVAYRVFLERIDEHLKNVNLISEMFTSAYYGFFRERDDRE